MKCEQCGNEFEGRKDAKFCSNKCKVAHFRGVTDNSVTDKNVTDVRKLTKDELYAAINSYPRDTWKESEEYAELMRRLKGMSVEELNKESYFIPGWKYPSLKEQVRA